MEQVGSGEFGQICQAEWSVSGATKEVAIKTLRAGSSEEEKVRFLQEAAIMGQFSHPCVVRLYGVVTVGHQVSCHISRMVVKALVLICILALKVMICIELMAKSDLKRHLCSIDQK